MTSRERLKAILDHKEADQVPLDLGGGRYCRFHKGIYIKMLDHFGLEDKNLSLNLEKIAQVVNACEDLLVKLESDIRVPRSLFNKPDKPNEEWEDENSLFFKDAWGTVFRMPKQGGLYYDQISTPLEGTFDDEEIKYDIPPPPGIMPETLEQAKAYHAAGYPVTIDGYGMGFLQQGARVYGYEDWMMLVGTEDRRAIEFMEKLLEAKMQHLDNVANLFGKDTIDVIYESDDLGVQSGPFISPELFRRFVKPYHKKLFDYMHHKFNVKVFHHTCGSVVKLIPDLIEIGVDILNPVQISAAGMDPEYLKREFGKDIVFWGGGIDTQNVLPRGTPAEIRDHVRRNIEVFSKDGGFVFGTVQNVQSDVPLKNVLAMWETFKEFRKY